MPPDDDGQIPIIAPASDCYDRTKVECCENLIDSCENLIAVQNLLSAEFV